MEWTTETLVALAAALGLGAILQMLVKGVLGWLGGRQARERAGWDAYDEAERERRQWEAWAHQVHLVAIRHGFLHLLPAPPQQLPQSWETPGSIIE